MNLVVEQGSMVITWGGDDVVRITHTAPDAYKPSLARKDPTVDPNAPSARELEVLRCLVAGDTNEEIGSQLKVSAATAKFHVASLMKKLDAKNRVVCAVMAVRAGLVQ